MGILLGRHGLEKVRNSKSGPSLLQEYSNHDGMLFKVYVLGKKVWVFKRPSLPNLPIGEIGEEEGRGFVEFDSQRPYPSLIDFGIALNSSEMENNISKIQRKHFPEIEVIHQDDNAKPINLKQEIIQVTKE